VELQDVDGVVHTDDNSVPKDWPLKRLTDLLVEAFAQFGTDANAAESGREYLEEAGFVNIQHNYIKLPYGTWPKDKYVRLCWPAARQTPMISSMNADEECCQIDALGRHVLSHRLRRLFASRGRHALSQDGLGKGRDGSIFRAGAPVHARSQGARLRQDALLERPEAPWCVRCVRNMYKPWIIA
jgi:hypothetical protein